MPSKFFCTVALEIPNTCFPQSPSKSISTVALEIPLICFTQSPCISFWTALEITLICFTQTPCKSFWTVALEIPLLQVNLSILLYWKFHTYLCLTCFQNKSFSTAELEIQLTCFIQTPSKPLYKVALSDHLFHAVALLIFMYRCTGNSTHLCNAVAL